MSKFTKTILVIGLVVTLYGYVCRAAPLNFFWESKYIGWTIILIGLIAFLFNRVSIKKASKKKPVLEKIGIGLLIFTLLVQAILIIVIPLTDAYKVSKEFLLSNSYLKNQIGPVKGFSLIPLGSIQKHSDNNGESGTATLLFTVKGEKKFMDVTVYVEKSPNTKWVVVGAE